MAIRIPLATYRLQFNPSFTFAAARLVPYLHALGLGDCYASPYFKARPGSVHGYYVIDHNSLNPESVYQGICDRGQPGERHDARPGRGVC